MKRALRFGTEDADLENDILCATFQREFGLKPDETRKMTKSKIITWLTVAEELKEHESNMLANKMAKMFGGK